MNSSSRKHAAVKVNIPEDILAKIEKVATDKNLSIEDALIFLLEVASHR